MVSFEGIRQAMGDLNDAALHAAMEEIMASGGADAQRAVDAMQQGMDIVGARYESGEYFVGDLICAGDMMSVAMERLKPALRGGAGQTLGRLLLCTVKDDLHDIGKNIVKSVLETGGFEVFDLGIDTSAAQILETARSYDIRIIALSGVLTLALDSMKATVEAFQAAGLREHVRIIIGGRPVSEAACRRIGADAWAISPQKTLRVCKAWAEEMA